MAILPNGNLDTGRKVIFTKDFVGNRRSMSAKTFTNLPAEVGYVTPDGEPLAPEYLIRITSIRNRCTVVAPMQEELQMKVGSRWENFIPSSLLGYGNIAAQIISRGKLSLITRATSRRIWQGSSPIIISLNLKFEAIEDPFIEVAEPCRILQSMSIPSDPSGGLGLPVDDLFNSVVGLVTGESGISDVTNALSKVPLLSPPGPTPFTVEGILDFGGTRKLKEDEVREGLRGGDIIIIEIGRFLTFYNVIVNDVTVIIPPKMDINGNPVSASANLVFETYEMMTIESLKQVYTKDVLSKNE